jgi:hypothetical protein
MSCDRLELIGLHCRLGDMNPETIEDTVWAMIAQMAWVRREYGPHPRPRGLREFEPFEWCHDRHNVRHTDALEEAVEDAWPRYRYPRPALVLSLRQSALIPPE